MRKLLFLFLSLPVLAYARPSNNTYQDYPHCRSQIIIDAIEGGNRHEIDRAFFEMLRYDNWNLSVGCIDLLFKADVDFLKEQPESRWWWGKIGNNSMFSFIYKSVNYSEISMKEKARLLKYMVTRRKADIIKKYDSSFKPQDETPVNWLVELREAKPLEAVLESGLPPGDAYFYLAKQVPNDYYQDYVLMIHDILQKFNADCNVDAQDGWNPILYSLWYRNGLLSHRFFQNMKCDLRKLGSSPRADSNTALTAMIDFVQFWIQFDAKEGKCSTPIESYSVDANFELLVKDLIKRDPGLQTVKGGPHMLTPYQMVNEKIDFYKSELNYLKETCKRSGSCSCAEQAEIVSYERLIALKDRYLKAVREAKNSAQ